MTNQEAIRILNEQRNKFMDDWIDYGGVNEAYNMAISLLKEQEAVKPVEEFIKGANRYEYHCKRCGNIVGTIFDDKHPVFPGVKLSTKHFCDVCGQAVKWDE